MRALAALANAPRRDSGATRRIYSYPAKFQAWLPAELIRRFTRPGELVVDPYCGGGTTALEAYLERRAFFGVDLSPFACLIARVKTTPVDARVAERAASAVLASTRGREILDADDRVCLGSRVSDEVARLAGGVAALDPSPEADLLLLALIHSLKIAGRRDFDADSIVPTFRRKVASNVDAAASLPRHSPRPTILCKSNHDLRADVDDGAAALVVTSPPYKDLDVEYALLQLQRPSLGRSKRSHAIWRLLDEPPIPKKTLCGGAGAAYWTALAPSLAEIRRLLHPSCPAFFWTGFKTDPDRRRFEHHLAAAHLPVTVAVPVRLSPDRVASSRSTHHGRSTGMLARDWLFGVSVSEVSGSPGSLSTLNNIMIPM